MSLDVYLQADTPPTAPNGGSGIFVRRNGETVEMSREEWDRAFPSQEPVVVTTEADANAEIYWGNITHNLGKMADAAGHYEPLWRPDEMAITKAKELIAPIEVGLEMLRADPEKYKALNPSNGWGSYEGLVKFAAAYLQACKDYPEANVRVWR